MSEESDDWFERAISKDNTESQTEETAPENVADDWDEITAELTADTDSTDGSTDSGGSTDSDDATPAEVDTDDRESDDGGSLFDQDFGAALSGPVPAATSRSDADETPTGLGERDETTPDIGDSERRSTNERIQDVGLGAATKRADTGGSLFDEDFGSAFENAGPVPGDGVSPSGGNGPPDSGKAPTFDEEAESDLPRIDLGIDGLDRMIQGGVPERSLMVAIGGAGTGKTTLGLQFLNHGLAQGESAVYITLEETRERVINSATEKGFPFDEYADSGQLAVIDLDPVKMANSLSSIQSELPRLVEGFGASRLVLDSVSLLELMYDDQATRRNEVYDFTKSLKEAGVTALMTSEASSDTPYASRHGIVEYLTDAVFVLQYIRPDDFRETRLAIEIQKIRDANHSREKKPYEITNEGLSVYQQANLF